MNTKRGATKHSGIIAVDKPSGLTSHDVVNRIRRISGERRIGHCGTLDPFATGLLILCVGPAARLANYLMDKPKSYLARIVFGVATDTDDKDGKIIETMSFANGLSDLTSEEFARHTLAQFVGVFDQVPPAYSAIKNKGVAAYETARRGETPVLAPRSIEVYSAELLALGFETMTAGFETIAAGFETIAAGFETMTAGFDLEQINPENSCNPSGLTQNSSLPYWDVAFEVSKGAYIRALARDIAQSLGACAYLSALRRTRSGSVRLCDSHTLAAIEDLGLEACYLDPLKALDFPAIGLNDEQYAQVINGRPLKNFPGAAPTMACVHDNTVLALYGYDEQRCGDLRPLAVIPGGLKGSK